MFELGLRRQDVITLKFSDFSNKNNQSDNYYRIQFYNKKNKKYRSFNISNSVVTAVQDYKTFM